MVLSYTTSRPITWWREHRALPGGVFREGEYLQIEVAGITTTGAKNPLAAKFLAFMTGPKFQNVIPETNWMFPAGKTDKPLNRRLINCQAGEDLAVQPGRGRGEPQGLGG